MTRRIVLLTMFLAAAAWSQQGYVVVVQKSNAIDKVSRAQLRRMLMGEVGTWPGGEKFSVLFGPSGSASRAAALKEICGMSESDYSKHALQLSFEGGGKPVPKSMPSDTAVRQFVQITRGALGIVDAGAVDGNLKVLSIE
jgi:ABC-type phosphate transport system substrate-binding protein